MMPTLQRSTYSARVEAGVVVVTDLDHGRSVTNDAAGVVEDLRAAGHDLSRPVIYRDTTGMWDRLLVRDGRFAGFRALGSTDYARARTLLADQLAREKAEAAEAEARPFGESPAGDGACPS